MTDCLIFRIRFHKHGSGSRPWILCILYVLLVWWRGNHGSAVGWSFCFYVPILFRFTSKKLVYLIRHIIRQKRTKQKKTFELYVHKSDFSSISKLMRRHAYCGACLLTASVLFQPTPAHAPPPPLPLPGGGGAVVLSFHSQVHI